MRGLDVTLERSRGDRCGHARRKVDSVDFERRIARGSGGQAREHDARAYAAGRCRVGLHRR